MTCKCDTTVKYARWVTDGMIDEQKEDPKRLASRLLDEAIELEVYIRDGGDREDILLELGDILYFWHRIARKHGITLKEAMSANMEKLTNRDMYGKGNYGKRS